MPEVTDFFADYKAMDLPTLHSEREAILSSAPEGDYSKLEDEPLSRLLAINRALRSKIAHTNSGSKKKAEGTKATRTPTELGDLA